MTARWTVAAHSPLTLPRPQKFPHSGGYVWIQEGAANKYTSVFRGSVFEASTSPPTVLLKLIYHWSCQVVPAHSPGVLTPVQTNIPNVAQWVKVDNTAIDTFFGVCRSLCVVAVQEEVGHLASLRY